MSDEAHPHEIIIIKRHGGGHEDGHHGGAWKIAYADFVTAMMAFFLVMWLLSANEKTKAAIVKYFNPIQLVDSTPQPPGLGDPSEKSPSPKKATAKPAPDKDVKEAKEAGAAKEAESKEPETKESAKGAAAKAEEAKKEEAKKEKEEAKKEEAKKDDAALFRDPYAALTEIGAKDAPPSRGGTKAPNDGNKGGAGTAAAAEGQGGDAFRDPFDPVAMAPRGDIEGAAEAGRGEALATRAPSEPQHAAVPPPAATAAASEPGSAPLPAEPAARAAELKNRIDALVKSVAAASSGPQPRIDVKATAEGILIGLTDDAKFSMFASASAEPSPRTVTLMEKIGRLLKGQQGQIVLRGYTDSRKYRSSSYDNWRLSSARADMAHYMLVRGGVDDARFERIEGYADRKPRNVKDPEAPENRRIEILLRNTP